MRKKRQTEAEFEKASHNNKRTKQLNNEKIETLGESSCKIRKSKGKVAVTTRQMSTITMNCLVKGEGLSEQKVSSTLEHEINGDLEALENMTENYDTQISSSLINKNKYSIQAHTNKGAWTKEEDQRLVNYIRAHGEGCWRSLPKAAGLQRCGKSCRLRWINYLRPNLKRGNFTEEEDELIIKLHSLLGNKWSVIAGKLPGRTDNEIKNYWNTHIKRKLISRGLDPQTHCPLNATAAAATSISTTKNICLDFRNTSVAATPLLINDQKPTYYSSSAEETKCSSGTTEERHDPVATEKSSGEVMINLELSIALPLQAMVAQRRPVVAASEMVKKAVCLCWQIGSQSGQQFCGKCQTTNGFYRYS
ncbi:hypothetical protein K7X08_025776 [Anisodus acutangulus]|uniref:Uncharacterized protein n=1 Tax=Anisodus acutangulus TaxID=402998 RepID=A0A9Q1LAV2_9SOLA|nr:hypothetical protein K7X08_025776 [Anisodus acutangulus]